MQHSESWSPVSRFLIVTASLVIVVAGMRASAQILVPVLLAAVLATALAPAFRWLQRKGLPSGLAILVLILALLLAGLSFTAIVASALSELAQNLPTYQQNLADEQTAVQAWLAARGIDLPGLLQGLDVSALATAGLRIVDALGSALSGVGLILLVAVFILLDLPGFEARVGSQVAGNNPLWQGLGRLSGRIQAYLRISTINNLILATALAVWLAVLGVDLAFFWGLLAFVLSYIPTIGLILASVPPVLLALAQYGLGRALVAAGGIVAINFVVDSFITPRITGAGLNLSVVTVLISLLFWAWVLGPLGALLAVPLTIAIKLALESYSETRWLAAAMSARTESPPGAPQP